MSSVIIEYRIPIVEHLLVMLLIGYKIEFLEYNYIYYSLAFHLELMFSFHVKCVILL